MVVDQCGRERSNCSGGCSVNFMEGYENQATLNAFSAVGNMYHWVISFCMFCMLELDVVSFLPAGTFSWCWV